MNHYYIYYRVSENNAHEAEPLVRAMQARLACSSGVQGRLLRKRDDPALWMEVYERVEHAERFELLLEQAADEFDVAMFLETPRRQECFRGENSSHAACDSDPVAAR